MIERSGVFVSADTKRPVQKKESLYDRLGNITHSQKENFLFYQSEKKPCYSG